MPHVVFIHGLANKPEADYLYKLWKRKLAHADGFDLDTDGVTSCSAHWSDVLYESPDTDLAAYERAIENTEVAQAVAMLDSIDESGLDPAQREKLEKLRRRLDLVDADFGPEDLTDAEREAILLERIPMPAWLRNRLMARFVRDAHMYFFNTRSTPRAGQTFAVRDELRKRFVAALRQGESSRPLVVVSHSMGTIIAYDTLKHDPACPRIDGLMTLGSPLGLDEVQDFFPKWTRDDGFPSERLDGRWVNVFDRLDPVVGLDPKFANDYRRRGENVVEDIEEPNWGKWRHSVSKYLQGKKLRGALREMLVGGG